MTQLPPDKSPHNIFFSAFMPTIPPKRPHSRAQDVVAHVSRMIEDGRIKPGTRIPSEAELIAALGVSRSVVREAVSHLQAAGMVETFQGKGTFAVAGTPQRMGLDPDTVESMQDVLAVLELRIMLEAEAAGLAATRATEAQLAKIRGALRDFLDVCQAGGSTADADTALHTAIAQATNNRYLYDTLHHLGRHFMPRTRVLTARLSRDAPAVFIERVMREHEDIVDAIVRRDPESARAAMRNHLANSRERLRRAAEAG
jgi:DNA-binding FadR family transcriptional regulator